MVLLPVFTPVASPLSATFSLCVYTPPHRARLIFLYPSGGRSKGRPSYGLWGEAAGEMPLDALVGFQTLCHPGR